jgi:hypothetical protein
LGISTDLPPTVTVEELLAHPVSKTARQDSKNGACSNRMVVS